MFKIKENMMNNHVIKLVIQKNKKAIIEIITGMLLMQIINISGAELMRRIIDSLTQFGDISKDQLCLYVVITLGQSVSTFIFSYYGELLQKKAILVMRNDFLKRYKGIKAGEDLCQGSQGEMFEIIYGDLAMVTNFCMNTVISMVQIFLSFSIIAIYLFILRWDMSLFIMLLNPVLIIGQSFMAPKVKQRSEDCRNSIGMVINAMQELFSNPLDIKMSGLQNALVKRVNKALQLNFAYDKKTTLIRTVSDAFSGFMGIAGHLIVFLYGCYLVSQHQIGVGVVVIFITYTPRVMGSFERISHYTIDYSAIMPNIKRLNPYFHMDYHEEQKERLKENYDIVFNCVSFDYQDDRKILDNVSFRFQYGKTYGIIGETGVGKSTVAKLMLGIWKPKQGNVLVGGIEVGEIEAGELDNVMAYFPANPVIIHDTVYSNLTMGAENISISEMMAVLEKMRLRETIKADTEAVNLMIGSGGCTLSAGEKQRIGLGRMFFSKKRIVIMDEPTAFLDDITKVCVIKELLKHNKDALNIIISHDMDILSECNEVICLENGKFKSLSRENGIWKREKA